MIQQQAALKREMEPSRLGNVLSDTTTRRVIIGILLMLMVLPILTYSGVDYTTEFGLRQLFWFGRSNCNQVSGDFFCQDQSDWINQEGWNQLLRHYYESTRAIETEDISRKLLWLYAPDFNEQGRMRDIVRIPNADGTGDLWRQEDDCAGFFVSELFECADFQQGLLPEDPGNGTHQLRTFRMP